MEMAATEQLHTKVDPPDYRKDPSQYKHWRLTFDGPVATLTMDVAEDGGIRPGYKLKLNSYDLGVDIELHDALQRISFEHPEIRSVIITSAKNGFCSGANIYMLGLFRMRGKSTSASSRMKRETGLRIRARTRD
jgi:benzoyl-CoA-dihydrodiol lyase